MPARECSRTACSRPAVSTLTYVYEDSTAVLGPLSAQAEPHSYDLCRDHAERLTAPRGWRLLRVPGEASAPDDISALAAAVDHRLDPGVTTPGSPTPPPPSGAPRRGLHVVRSPRD
nr:DUF3499 domain-containing protein [Brachybacterium sillae]